MPSLEARRRPLDSMPWSRRVAEILVPVSPATGADDLETWLLARIAGTLEADPLGIDPTLPPSAYGFEGAPARALTRELERRLGRGLPEDVFARAPSVRAVARGLCPDTIPRSFPSLPAREEMRRHLLAERAETRRRSRPRHRSRPRELGRSCPAARPRALRCRLTRERHPAGSFAARPIHTDCTQITQYCALTRCAGGPCPRRTMTRAGSCG